MIVVLTNDVQNKEACLPNDDDPGCSARPPRLEIAYNLHSSPQYYAIKAE